MGQKRWKIKKTGDQIGVIAKQLNIHIPTAQVLINRGIKSIEQAQQFLYPDLSQLQPVELMKDVTLSFDLLAMAIEKGQKITIYGDYDVDGIMSTIILYKGLKELGAQVRYYIPQREEEGYGLNLQAVSDIRENGTEVLLTCDNGIAAIEEIEEAKRLGLTVIVIDHHEPGFSGEDGERQDIVPAADAVIDPKQEACKYPFTLMCAAGICYRFIEGFFTYMQNDFKMARELLIMASIATFCDIVDLYGENRILAHKGLAVLNEQVHTNLGLLALMECKSLGGKQITAFDIGFIIGPCINATGRLTTAAMSVELFLTEDPEEAANLAQMLARINEERKLMTGEAVERALAAMETATWKQDKILVLYDDQIHESIAGIVAGRIKELTYHPVIVLTNGENCVKGSGRSIPSYNMFEGLYNCKDLFLRFGGHAMAAGMSLEKANIEPLRKQLNEEARLEDDDFIEEILVDYALPLKDVTFALAKELKLLHPFGKGNREPCFGAKNVKVEELRVLENKNTLIFSFGVEGTYRKIKGLSFGKVGEFSHMLSQNYDEDRVNKIMHGILRNCNLLMDILYSIEINEYNNNVSVQVRLKDFRIAASGESKNHARAI